MRQLPDSAQISPLEELHEFEGMELIGEPVMPDEWEVEALLAILRPVAERLAKKEASDVTERHTDRQAG